MTIREFYGMRAVAAYKSGHGDTPNAPNPNLLVGLELEIENWPPRDENLFGGIRFASDGSLRNNGVEAITEPLPIRSVPHFLRAFFNHFGITENNYSERCSTHVHVNAQPMTFEQLSSLCLLYQTVERLLFQFIGNHRDTNIFCVPWYQSGVTYSLVNNLENVKEVGDFPIQGWQKYSALNLLPLREQGTVEFRHLYGTCNVDTIMKWLGIIGKMVEFSMKTSLADVKEAIVKMNSVSNYRVWLEQIFQEYSVHLMVNPRYEEELSLGIIDSKMMLHSPKSDSKKKKDQDRIMDLIEMERQRLEQTRRFTFANGPIVGGAANAAVQARANPNQQFIAQWAEIPDAPVEDEFRF